MKENFDPNGDIPPLTRSRIKSEMKEASVKTPVGAKAEDVSHLLTCEAYTHARSLFSVDRLHAEFGWKFFTSLPFYAWMTYMFDPSAKNDKELQHIMQLATTAKKVSERRRMITQDESEEPCSEEDTPFDGVMVDEDEYEYNPDEWRSADDDGFLDRGETPDDYGGPIRFEGTLDDKLKAIMAQLKQTTTNAVDDNEEVDNEEDGATLAPAIDNRGRDSVVSSIKSNTRVIQLNKGHTYCLHYKTYSKWRMSQRPTINDAMPDPTPTRRVTFGRKTTTIYYCDRLRVGKAAEARIRRLEKERVTRARRLKPSAVQKANTGWASMELSCRLPENNAASEEVHHSTWTAQAVDRD